MVMHSDKGSDSLEKETKTQTSSGCPLIEEGDFFGWKS
jgi:hypothetical protein